MTLIRFFGFAVGLTSAMLLGSRGFFDSLWIEILAGLVAGAIIAKVLTIFVHGVDSFFIPKRSRMLEKIVLGAVVAGTAFGALYSGSKLYARVEALVNSERSIAVDFHISATRGVRGSGGILTLTTPNGVAFKESNFMNVPSCPTDGCKIVFNPRTQRHYSTHATFLLSDISFVCMLLVVSTGSAMALWPAWWRESRGGRWLLVLSALPMAGSFFGLILSIALSFYSNAQF